MCLKYVIGTKKCYWVTSATYVSSMTPVTFLVEFVLSPVLLNTYEMLLLLKYFRGDEYFYGLPCNAGTRITFV
jgi:hypothetical protein